MELKPIISNDELNLKNLFLYLIKRNRRIIKICLYGIIIFTIYFFLKTPTYSSSVSFYTNYKSGDVSSQSFLGSFANNFLSESDLQFSIENYIISDKFLKEVVEKEYLIDNKKINLVDLWGVNFNNYFSLNPLATILLLNRNISFGNSISEYEKKLFHSKYVLRKNLTLNKDSESNLYTLIVDVKKHPELSEKIIDIAYESIINYSYQITKVKAEEKITFIKAQVEDIEKSLDNAEKNMVIFLESNNNIQSPSLLVQKNRLETEIALFSQLYISLNDQLELAKIEEQDITSSIYLLDTPKINPIESGLSLLKGYVLLGVLIYMITFILLIYRDREKIII